MQLYFRGFMDKFGVVIAVCDREVKEKTGQKEWVGTGQKDSFKGIVFQIEIVV